MLPEVSRVLPQAAMLYTRDVSDLVASLELGGWEGETNTKGSLTETTNTLPASFNLGDLT